MLNEIIGKVSAYCSVLDQHYTLIENRGQGSYSTEEIWLPENDTDVDQIYDFELYIDDLPTGSKTYVIVIPEGKETTVHYMEAEKIIVLPRKLLKEGGPVSVRITFKSPPN